MCDATRDRSLSIHPVPERAPVRRGGRSRGKKGLLAPCCSSMSLTASIANGPHDKAILLKEGAIALPVDHAGQRSPVRSFHLFTMTLP